MSAASGMISHREGSPANTIMVDVEPGDTTGIYYVLLPFSASWQDFKDWLRVDCDVEYVELFQLSTSGWIRLRGQENVTKLMSRLRDVRFQDNSPQDIVDLGHGHRLRPPKLIVSLRTCHPRERA
ncbi:hypothetical protein E4U17_000726 [Claviceps sp. LM77 group G4]|nr:hypothetical protein E4U17_000726 [Claviceps sp. LM77 group G4]KAG6069844.1 hypothetical protein E4U16_007321 [Claviceps sp. LM84 group G4]KAG6085304.1 hypothetical protein E4U33_002095 [Claviceps sp. LM78 group G4]